jgi:hypothetical protein
VLAQNLPTDPREVQSPTPAAASQSRAVAASYRRQTVNTHAKFTIFSRQPGHLRPETVRFNQRLTCHTAFELSGFHAACSGTAQHIRINL